MQVHSDSERRGTKRTNPARNARRRQRHWLLRLAIELGLREAPSTSAAYSVQTHPNSHPVPPSLSSSSSTNPSNSVISAVSISETIAAADTTSNLPSMPLLRTNLLPPTNPNRSFEFFDWDASPQHHRSRRNRRRRRRENRGPNLAEMEVFFPEDGIDPDFQSHYTAPSDVLPDVIENLVDHYQINIELDQQQSAEQIPDLLLH